MSSLSAWLSSAPASSLGRAAPVSRPAAAGRADVSDSDDSDAEDVEDERLLELRRLADLEEGGEDGMGNDWIARYAGSSEEDEPPPQRAKVKKARPAQAEPAPAPEPAPTKAPTHKGLTAGAAVPVVALKHVTVLAEPVAASLPKPAPAPANARPEPGVAEARIAKPPKRPLPKAFVPESEDATVFVGNLPLNVGDDAVRDALSKFGKVRVFHREVSNSGAPQGFGYGEFRQASSAAKAIGTSFTIGDRESKVLKYTATLNHRNADGSRRKEKKRKREGGDATV